MSFMEFSSLVSVYESLERTTKRLEMTDITALFLKEVRSEELEILVYFLLGKVFPDWSNREMGIGYKLVVKVVSDISGIPVKRIEDFIRTEGDIGKACEKALSMKRQSVLFEKSLSIKTIYETLTALPEHTGSRSQERKLKSLSFLFTSATPREVRYLVRIVLGEMRTGVGEGIVRDAIAQAFGVSPETIDKAYMLTNDLGAVAKSASGGEEEMKRLSITFFKPIKFMLASISDFDDALSRMPILGCEIKYDGSRCQVHKKGETIRIFSRRLEDITEALPEIVESMGKAIWEDAIVEGEIIAFKHGKPQPFQNVLRRLRRKYDIDEMKKKIPLKLMLFDCLWCRGSCIDMPLRHRRETLVGITTPSDIILVSEQLVTDKRDKMEEFFKQAISSGHEGLMVKDPDSSYQPGSRGKKWLKIKQTLETLDLVIIGAEWGEGRRAHWLASFLLGIRDEYGRFLEVGKVGTGITDEMFGELTEKLTPYIVSQEGKVVKLHPHLILEIAYEEIQKSPNYESGYALRFPRVRRIREDKGPEDADSLDRLYEIVEGV
jgi:DNA ligase-1